MIRRMISLMIRLWISVFRKGKAVPVGAGLYIIDSSEEMYVYGTVHS
jgi:hypothetical protein